MRSPIVVAAALVTLILVLSVSIAFVFLNYENSANNGVSTTPSSVPSNLPETTPFEAQHYTYTVIHTYPHDSTAFTEGLVYADSNLYESTGAYASNSTLRRVDLTSGNVHSEVATPDFGEGIAVVNGTIIQLTWRSHTGFLYNKTSLGVIGNFTYPNEGWGLTYDGKQLIMSDGSSNLYFLDPVTFQRVGQVQVHDGRTSVAQINELEYVNGSVYANIFQQRTIAIINPETGQVTGWVDLSGLQGAPDTNPETVLNGIAYDAAGDRLFVTGKDWPNLYEIKLVPAST
jgi:glutamine cyclotransferase